MSGSDRVQVSAAARGDRPLRCAFCHDDLPAGESETCPACGARWHLDCGRELVRCPTLACEGLPLGAAPQIAPRGWRWLVVFELFLWGPLFFMSWALLAGWLATGARLGEHADMGDRITMAGLAVFGGLLVHVFGGRWLAGRLRAWWLERRGVLTPALAEWVPRSGLVLLRYRYRDADGREHVGESAVTTPAMLRRRCRGRSIWVWVDPRRPERSRWVDDA